MRADPQRDGGAADRGDRTADAGSAQRARTALAAVGVAVEMGVPDETIRTGFAKFGGVKRRFTKVGEVAVDGNAT
jgi:UDP-N-acetylmuramate--alanine ligase